MKKNIATPVLAQGGIMRKNMETKVDMAVAESITETGGGCHQE